METVVESVNCIHLLVQTEECIHVEVESKCEVQGQLLTVLLPTSLYYSRDNAQQFINSQGKYDSYQIQHGTNSTGNNVMSSLHYV